MSGETVGLATGLPPVMVGGGGVGRLLFGVGPFLPRSSARVRVNAGVFELRRVVVLRHHLAFGRAHAGIGRLAPRHRWRRHGRCQHEAPARGTPRGAWGEWGGGGHDLPLACFVPRLARTRFGVLARVVRRICRDWLNSLARIAPSCASTSSAGAAGLVRLHGRKVRPDPCGG